MAEISEAEVRHVASLAKLALSEEELARVGRELNRIMGYFAELQELDTSATPITSHAIPLVNVYREDVVGESLPPAEAVQNAPDGVDGYFRVPRIVE
ncbi:MAG TPA: Asp-tRNA(Asn)/Glu-tRNA(Gln) amidotransferase subunit GatC [Armatimonadota bacterium]